MDCDTVETAVKVLLEEIAAELDEIKPGLLYEYRQRYIGPAINRFGNMLRVGDCAYDSLTNRIGMVNLRMMNYPLAVHSDMLCWSPKEEPKLCAKQLLNVLFCVPQISVFLADITEEQKKLLKHYLDYWTANRDILLHGEFCARYPEYNYTYISAEGADKVIAAVYADMPYTYTGKACDVHLNGNCDSLAFENPTDKVLAGEIYDCFGNLIDTVAIAANSFVRLPVPETGMLAVRE
jgi:alpha-galactosidase